MIKFIIYGWNIRRHFHSVKIPNPIHSTHPFSHLPFVCLRLSWSMEHGDEMHENGCLCTSNIWAKLIASQNENLYTSEMRKGKMDFDKIL